MSGKKAKLGSDKHDTPRQHYCPECLAAGSNEIMKPSKVLPGWRTIFECRQHHQRAKGQTSLR